MCSSGWAAYLPWRAHYATITDPSRYPIEWLDAQVWSGTIQAWASADAGILAKLETYPTGLRDVHGMAAAGTLAGIKQLITVAEDWGRSMGCSAALIESRPGWAKALRSEGYAMHQVSIRKAL